jgi:hypothetical protein
MKKLADVNRLDKSHIKRIGGVADWNSVEAVRSKGRNALPKHNGNYRLHVCRRLGSCTEKWLLSHGKTYRSVEGTLRYAYVSLRERIYGAVGPLFEGEHVFALWIERHPWWTTSGEAICIEGAEPP